MFACPRLRTVLVAVALACITVAAQEPHLTPEKGRTDATKDVAEGHYVILTYGLPARWTLEYARLLHVRYGIELRAIADCLVSEEQVSYAAAYNEVSSTAAKKKWGEDIFRKANEEAFKTWSAKRHKQNSGG